jgi:hypothetical protein
MLACLSAYSNREPPLPLTHSFGDRPFYQNCGDELENPEIKKYIYNNFKEQQCEIDV